MLPFSGQIPGALGLAILEESKEALVDAVDGLEELINPHGLASYFMRGGVRGYGVAELRGAADTFSCQLEEHRLGIVLPRLAVLTFLNGPRRLSHMISCSPD